VKDTMNHPGQDAPAPVRASVLSPTLHRDLADLNAQYLDLGLAPGVDNDPRFAWAGAVRHRLLEADAGTLLRIAAAPFALFDLLPPPTAGAASTSGVEDGLPVSRSSAWLGRCDSFAHQAAFLARRLVENDAPASRVVLPLSADARAWLLDCRPSQLAEAASSPRLIRPRWRLHTRFWETLIGAARRDSPQALHWACCIGVCLIGADDAASTPLPPRRRTRR
jgi:hypothetical protein